MSKIVIKGGRPLIGNIRISGSKNAALPIMAASLLIDGPIVLNNVPNLKDTQTMSLLLRNLGVKIKTVKNSVYIDTSMVNNQNACASITRKMRASFLILGPLLSRFGKAKIGLPGGCSLGYRPIDYHIDALVKMGAFVQSDGRYISARTKKRLKGCIIDLPMPSVGATENILMAAVLAEGTTTINNVAIEPEVTDLANFLLSIGADITGIGTRKLIINGVKYLCANKDYNVIPDRIEAATYCIAAYITGGEVTLRNVNFSHIFSFLEVLKKIGAEVQHLSPHSIKILSLKHEIKPIDIITGVYPEIPTDVQSLLTPILALAKGKSSIIETIFNNRFGHVNELNLMGSNIFVKSNKAYISGVNNLSGNTVTATDLRAGAALAIAALSAQGTTIIQKAHHIDRGYENFEAKLQACKADIEKVVD